MRTNWKVVIQTVLDGKVIAENQYEYGNESDALEGALQACVTVEESDGVLAINDEATI